MLPVWLIPSITYFSRKYLLGKKALVSLFRRTEIVLNVVVPRYVYSIPHCETQCSRLSLESNHVYNIVTQLGEVVCIGASRSVRYLAVISVRK